MRAILKRLKIRVLPAPIARGPTTPDSVIAAEHNGSFGALALGTASLNAVVNSPPRVSGDEPDSREERMRISPSAPRKRG